MHTQAMISTHPDVRGNVNVALLKAIDLCFDCAQACTACADACLAEKDVAELTQCIRLNLDCADLCLAAAAIASRRTGSNERIVKGVIEVCAEACRLCAEECNRHGPKHTHCGLCAEACLECQRACRAAGASIATKQH